MSWLCPLPSLVKEHSIGAWYILYMLGLPNRLVLVSVDAAVMLRRSTNDDQQCDLVQCITVV